MKDMHKKVSLFIFIGFAVYGGVLMGLDIHGRLPGSVRPYAYDQVFEGLLVLLKSRDAGWGNNSAAWLALSSSLGMLIAYLLATYSKKQLKTAREQTEKEGAKVYAEKSFAPKIMMLLATILAFASFGAAIFLIIPQAKNPAIPLKFFIKSFSTPLFVVSMFVLIQLFQDFHKEKKHKLVLSEYLRSFSIIFVTTVASGSFIAIFKPIL